MIIHTAGIYKSLVWRLEEYLPNRLRLTVTVGSGDARMLEATADRLVSEFMTTDEFLELKTKYRLINQKRTNQSDLSVAGGRWYALWFDSEPETELIDKIAMGLCITGVVMSTIAAIVYFAKNH